MRQTFPIPVDRCLPDPAAVLSAQGVPRPAAADPRVGLLASRALQRLEGLAEPKGLLLELSRNEFAAVYGDEARSPLSDAFPRSDRLALFAVTIGGGPEEDARRLFAAGDCALGSMLDAAASCAAERAADEAQRRFQAAIAHLGGSATLRYSPGYCGWSVRGQRRLFNVLHPEGIGIELRESCLMTPLKSISGVIVVGPREIHVFERVYDCCATCTTCECVERARASLGG